MHPVIAAYIRWREAVALNIRRWSPYYVPWTQLCDLRLREYQEMVDENGTGR